MTDRPGQYLGCPHCGAVFRIPAGPQAIGDVRCGNCAGVFCGDEHLVAPSGAAVPGMALSGAPSRVPATARGGAPAFPDVTAARATDAQAPAETAGAPVPQAAAEAGVPEDADESLDLSGEAVDFYIDETFGHAADGDTQAAAEHALSADEGLSDAAWDDLLGDLPDADATLSLDDPLLDLAEDSVENIDLSERAGDASGREAQARSGAPSGVPDAQARSRGDTGLSGADDAAGAAPSGEDGRTGPARGARAAEVRGAGAAAGGPVSDVDRTLQLPMEELVAQAPGAAPDGPDPEATLRLAAETPEAETPGRKTPEREAAPPEAAMPGDVPEPAPVPGSGAPAAGRAAPPGATAASPDVDVDLKLAEAPHGDTADTAQAEQLPPAGLSLAGFIGWSAAALVLLLVLAGQGLYALRGTLQADPAYRPYVARLCDLIGCALPPLRAPEQIAIYGREVQSHPDFRDALLVTASIANRAPFAQPYPRVLLRFSDSQGTPYAERLFEPEEYLDGPLVDPERFVSEVPVTLRLELIDPGPGAVRYDFEFL